MVCVGMCGYVVLCLTPPLTATTITNRAFLNHVATDILHLNHQAQRLLPFKGNYDAFEATRGERYVVVVVVVVVYVVVVVMVSGVNM